MDRLTKKGESNLILSSRRLSCIRASTFKMRILNYEI